MGVWSETSGYGVGEGHRLLHRRPGLRVVHRSGREGDRVPTWETTIVDMSVESAVKIVRQRGGVARTSELMKAGATRGDLVDALDSGSLIRPRNGIYVLPETSTPILEAVSHRGVIACVTAARELGIWTLDDAGDERAHTWVEPQYRPTRVAVHLDPVDGACCVFHHDHRVDAPTLSSVGVLHCLVQILSCFGEEVFFAALESALTLGLVDAAGRRQLRQRIAAPFRWLVDFARTDAGSGLESLLRLRLHRRGLAPACQVAIPGVGIVDFVLGDCLIIEADGGTHDGPARHRDRVRDAMAMALGFVTLRFDYAMIVHDWELVENSVLAAVTRNLHRSIAGSTW